MNIFVQHMNTVQQAFHLIFSLLQMETELVGCAKNPEDCLVA